MKKRLVSFSERFGNTSQISVIIPCFRSRATIRRAVASVATQSLIPAEVILVEDASGDGTLEVLFDLQRFYGSAWIKVIPMIANGGPSVARNVGWNFATQPFIAFLDADDAWHQKKLEIQYSWMQNHPQVAMTCHTSVCVEKSGIEYNLIPESWGARRISARSLMLSNCISTPTVMIRRELPFRFEPAKRYSEDYLLWLQIIISGHSAYQLDLRLAYLYKSRYGEAGLSANLWEMEKGELGNYYQLRKEQRISTLMYCLLVFYSFFKYLIRCAAIIINH